MEEVTMAKRKKVGDNHTQEKVIYGSIFYMIR